MIYKIAVTACKKVRPDADFNALRDALSEVTYGQGYTGYNVTAEKAADGVYMVIEEEAGDAYGLFRMLRGFIDGNVMGRQTLKPVTGEEVPLYIGDYVTVETDEGDEVPFFNICRNLGVDKAPMCALFSGNPMNESILEDSYIDLDGCENGECDDCIDPEDYDINRAFDEDYEAGDGFDMLSDFDDFEDFEDDDLIDNEPGVITFSPDDIPMEDDLYGDETNVAWEDDLYGEDLMESYKAIDNAFNKKDNAVECVNEKKKSCCGGGKKTVNEKRETTRLVSLTEALKAYEPKEQKKLDKAVNSVEDIIKAVKGQTIGEGEAKDAMKKLKAEQNALKKIKKDADTNFSLNDVKGVGAALKKIIAADPKNAADIKKFRDSLTESVVVALTNKQTSLHTNVTIDKKPVKNMSSKELMEAYNKTKESRNKLVHAMSESTIGSPEYNKYKKDHSIKGEMMRIIAEELTYRNLVKRNKLNEDEEKEAKGDDNGAVDSMDDLAAMFGTSPEELTGDTENTDEAPAEDAPADENTDEAEEVELARVVIQMADKESAEQLRDLCKDAGIPEDAMEIEEGEEESIDEPEDDVEGEDNDAEGETEEQNESLRYRNIRALYEAEDEEGEGDAPAEGEGDDAPADDAAEETEEEPAEDGVKFILTNTDYVDQLAKVLEDEYGIEAEEFEQMIGGEIVSDDSDDNIDEPEEGEDNTEEKKDDDTEEADDLTAADIFGNM